MHPLNIQERTREYGFYVGQRIVFSNYISSWAGTKATIKSIHAQPNTSMPDGIQWNVTFEERVGPHPSGVQFYEGNVR